MLGNKGFLSKMNLRSTWNYFSEPFYLWVISTLLLFLLVYIGSFFSSPEFIAWLSPPDHVLAPFTYWDGGWYLGIATNGYSYDPDLHQQQNVAFFPLYPMSVRLLTFIGLDEVVSGLLISNTSLLLAACILYRYVCVNYSKDAARWVVWLWFFFPTAIFGHLYYADPLLALFTIWFLVRLKKRDYIGSGFLVGLASATRPHGFLVGVPLIIGFFRGHYKKTMIAFLLSTIGIFSYMFYCQYQFGEGLAFLHIRQYWGAENEGSWNPLIWFVWLFKRLVPQEGQSLPLFLSSNSYLLLWGLFWLPFVWKLEKWHIALGSAALCIIPFMTTKGTFTSFARYFWTIVPLFIAGGVQLHKSFWRWPTIIIFVVYFSILAVCFGSGMTII